MVDFGEAKFTENTPVQEYGEDKVLILSTEVILYKQPVEMTAEEVMKELGTDDSSVKFYKAHSYHYSREEWEATHDGQTEENKDAINEILENVIPNM